MKLLQKLNDITEHIQIKPSIFSVTHQNIQSHESMIDISIQMRNLPARIQHNYVRSLVKHLIYNIYFSGSYTKQESHIVKDRNNRLVKITSEIDWDLYYKLHKNNMGKGSFFSNCPVLNKEADGNLTVKVQDIALNIQPENHLQLAERKAVIGDAVAISMPSSQLKRGYYTAIGDAMFSFTAPVVLVYFNFSVEGAVALMKSLTTRLNIINIPFVFLVFYNPSSYGGYYSGFIRFHKDNYKSVQQVLKTVYKKNQSYFQEQVPLFTKVLAPGIALTEEPKQPFQSFENLGMNRCTVVAHALMEAHEKGDESPETRMQYIIQHFDRLGIDLERPYLNPDSEDIYTPLE